MIRAEGSSGYHNVLLFPEGGELKFLRFRDGVTEFLGQEVELRGLGLIQATGLRENTGSDDSAIVFAGGSLQEGLIREFEERGFYDFRLHLRGLSSTRVLLVCRMKFTGIKEKFPGIREVLVNTLKYGEDLLAGDRAHRFNAGTDNPWRMEGSDTQGSFFVPADPKVLSQLRFDIVFGERKT